MESLQGKDKLLIYKNKFSLCTTVFPGGSGLAGVLKTQSLFRRLTFFPDLYILAFFRKGG